MVFVINENTNIYDISDYSEEHGMNNIICNLSRKDINKILKITNNQETTKKFILSETYNFNQINDLLTHCEINEDDLYEYFLDSDGNNNSYFCRWGES